VPPDDASALAAALRRLLEDEALRADLARRSAARGAALPLWKDAARAVARTVLEP
jgi:hypothetical protein